ncbi:GNAT family N-acetyltransferase [Miniphocaeibacter massiliensis]|uniref:GNAT family N-acetyltransferase n=1 Tax=Miniphocaeibacter massiliensis TaxID=2041841 RepID=UPI001A92FDD8
MLLQNYLVATIDNEVVAFIALVTDDKRAFNIPLKDFQKHFGFFRGYMFGIALSNDFEKTIPLDSDSAYIDILGVSKKYQRQGLASKLIEYVIKKYKYKTLTLNVTNVNSSAISLYKKHGFQEYSREKVKFAKQKGFSEYIYLKYSKN